MKRSKYNNHKVKFDGITFDSKKELRRYHELKALERQGLISSLEVHKSFPLIVPGLGPIVYRGKRTVKAVFKPDFVYLDEKGQMVVEDVKSPITSREKYFRLKKAVFELLYKTEVRIT